MIQKSGFYRYCFCFCFFRELAVCHTFNSTPLLTFFPAKQTTNLANVFGLSHSYLTPTHRRRKPGQACFPLSYLYFFSSPHHPAGPSGAGFPLFFQSDKDFPYILSSSPRTISLVVQSYWQKCCPFAYLKIVPKKGHGTTWKQRLPG